MSGAAVRVGVGSRLHYDGEAVEIIELAISAAGNEAVLKNGRGGLLRVSVRELMFGGRARIAEETGVAAAGAQEPAAAVLAQLSTVERARLLERAAHMREVLTGYRSGSAQLAGPDEPRVAYALGVPLGQRYAAKAAELGVGYRTVERWAAAMRQGGEAGLASAGSTGRVGAISAAFEPWAQIALEVMAEHVDASKPSRSFVIERVAARIAAGSCPDPVKVPSRAAAFRILEQLERRQPLFRLSAQRNRDIADRPATVYGKLRPVRPGEYLLMDTTRLDVFGLDPATLRWVRAELTVAMDWYTRCVTGIRVTPVSTQAVDVCATLYQTYRPRAAGPDWPDHAVWPEHGIPRSVLVERSAVDGPIRAAGPALVPETLVVDHGKVYVSEHLTSVCQRLGISVQPVRLRTGRDKGPVERFFRTLREDLLQKLPGYKGPDLASRGSDSERDAVFFLHELEAVIREWVASVYHHRPHDGLVDPQVPGLKLSPARMFEHGLARGGYIEAPRSPDLAFEFLPVRMRTIQHYGVQIGRRRYNGPALDAYRSIAGPYRAGSARIAARSWAFHVNPDDIARIYFRDPATGAWHALEWEHAASVRMPLSDEALEYGRSLASQASPYPDDKAAVAALLERWSLGIAATPTERRMALRLVREQAALDLPVLTTGDVPERETAESDARGDDDEDDDLGEGAEFDDFYADALEDA